MQIITILSPAKILKMEKVLSTNLYTQPMFINEDSALIKELVKYYPPEMEDEKIEQVRKVNKK